MLAPRTYECAANAHCSVSCQVDGEKQMQTGAPKTVTITPLTPNSYIVELVEQNGHVQNSLSGRDESRVQSRRADKKGRRLARPRDKNRPTAFQRFR
jgi:hypothetical protein